MKRILAVIIAAFAVPACAPGEESGPAASATPEPVLEEPHASEPAPAEDVASIPIGETGGLCGGIAAFQCHNEDDYCALKEGECVSVADAAGTCQPKPEMCTMDYNPVCGCDGETYGNACAAASAGVNVASKGECSKETE